MTLGNIFVMNDISIYHLLKKNPYEIRVEIGGSFQLVSEHLVALIVKYYRNVLCLFVLDEII